MEVKVLVDVSDKILEKMEVSKVVKLLTSFLDSNAEEFLKEQYEDETGEWIEG